MSRAGLPIVILGFLAVQLSVGTSHMLAGDLKIPLPRRGISTPTQKLNRDGVAELKRGHRDKAKRLFYRAYLLDPEDPFTLNNLGYVAELEGDADRALRYYALAAKDHTDAVIDQSSEADLKGRSLDDVFGTCKIPIARLARSANKPLCCFKKDGFLKRGTCCVPTCPVTLKIRFYSTIWAMLPNPSGILRELCGITLQLQACIRQSRLC